ncbi:hypothetical protein [Aerococcus viridans]|uniref:hypothetical protein n=1 Tax=Aerococcus viridans TaxID=1377 RepID=UPI002DBCD0DA|nr:hypothetical protein [Aerococcus viridans]MEC1386521.1 hypothetical protein [Aerococcus viridans]
MNKNKLHEVLTEIANDSERGIPTLLANNIIGKGFESVDETGSYLERIVYYSETEPVIPEFKTESLLTESAHTYMTEVLSFVKNADIDMSEYASFNEFIKAMFIRAYRFESLMMLDLLEDLSQ